MSWMHDRALAPRNRRRSQQRSTVTGPAGVADGAVAAHVPGTATEVALLESAGHVGIPRILGRRARWVTSRLRQR
ncbi:hypothetical protein [Streptacidiphilus fuscans]|uniref:Uncharacterized protein n=1 Tax=Streptacidiphilus fuscans TaxID=2789292 RepID=A0A931B7V3_9ACTN|nr:hypothetical protein [Streptacidiphilus fuscans]MBF9070636.1 hypothetical protein [Streptacidiphilus fuscans]